MKTAHGLAGGLTSRIWLSLRVAMFGLGWTATCVAAHGQPDATSSLPSTPQPTISFSYERSGLPVPSYRIELKGQAGRYAGVEVTQPGRYGGTAVSQPFDREFPLSDGMDAKILGLTHELKNFNVECGTKLKNIADTGAKTLTYSGPAETPPAAGSCRYHYSDSKAVEELTTIFQAIATTMDTGRELEKLHRYDRLGLDAALGSLMEASAAGRAMELASIAGTLQAIAADTELMQRARSRATTLLTQASEEGTVHLPTPTH